MHSFNSHTGEAETGISLGLLPFSTDKCSMSVRDLDFRNTTGGLTSDLYKYVHTCALPYVYLPYKHTGIEIFTEKGMNT